jgi:hypothetical protein
MCLSFYVGQIEHQDPLSPEIALVGLLVATPLSRAAPPDIELDISVHHRPAIAIARSEASSYHLLHLLAKRIDDRHRICARRQITSSKRLLNRFTKIIALLTRWRIVAIRIGTREAADSAVGMSAPCSGRPAQEQQGSAKTNPARARRSTRSLVINSPPVADYAINIGKPRHTLPGSLALSGNSDATPDETCRFESDTSTVRGANSSCASADAGWLPRWLRPWRQLLRPAGHQRRRQ